MVSRYPACPLHVGSESTSKKLDKATQAETVGGVVWSKRTIVEPRNNRLQEGYLVGAMDVTWCLK